MNKSILWLSIDGNDMMRDSMNKFMDFLHKFNIDFITYQSESDDGLIYLKLRLPNVIVQDKNHEFHKGMGEWVFYAPINLLRSPPKISDYNIIEDMSDEPYNIDKWKNI